MRLDKWLWCARFYKTRSLATNAIKSGKVTVNDIRAKSAKLIRVDDRLIIRRGPYRFLITILTLTTARKSASEAALLYQENQESIDARNVLATQIKNNAAPYPGTRGRPTKRDQRELRKFKEINK